MNARRPDPDAHVLRAPGRRLALAVPLRFVRERVAGRRRRAVTAAVSVVGLLDIMLVTTLFVLAFHPGPAECAEPRVHVPGAEHGEALIDAPLVTVTPFQILVDGVQAGSSRAIEDTGRIVRVDELANLLAAKRELWRSVQPQKPFAGVCLLMVDERVPALVVKSVYFTVAHAGYPQVSLVVRKLP